LANNSVNSGRKNDALFSFFISPLIQSFCRQRSFSVWSRKALEKDELKYGRTKQLDKEKDVISGHTSISHNYLASDC
jgi:hypothetical protein